MKILILTLDNYPHIGGKSTHIASLISGLKSEKVECKIISRSNIAKYKMNLYKLCIYPLRFINIKKYLYLRKLNEFHLFQKLLKKELKKNQYNYVSCQDALACTAVGRLSRKLRITLTMHTYFGLEYTLDNNYFKIGEKYYEKLLSLEEESLDYAHNVVGVDERIYNHIMQTLKAKKENRLPNVHVDSIINFTNTDIFNDEKEQHTNFNIMCVRRLVEKNGVIYLVKAMKEIIQNPSIQLHIYGDGPCREEIENYIKSNHLTNVIMHGSIQNDELPKIYKLCDLVVVPSITVNGLQEATSISAIEAMSCAIPVIASNIGGLAQMITQNVNGILVDEKDSKMIAKEIIRLYNDYDLQKKISKNSRVYVLEHHSHIIATKQYLKIFSNE